MAPVMDPRLLPRSAARISKVYRCFGMKETMATQSKNAGLKKALREADDDTRAEILNGLPTRSATPRAGAHPLQEGQPRRTGRRRGSQNLHTVVREVFSQEIPVTKNGKRRKVPRREVIIEQIANKSCAGDLKAAAISIDLMSKTGELSAPQMAEFPRSAASLPMRSSATLI